MVKQDGNKIKEVEHRKGDRLDKKEMLSCVKENVRICSGGQVLRNDEYGAQGNRGTVNVHKNLGVCQSARKVNNGLDDECEPFSARCPHHNVELSSCCL